MYRCAMERTPYEVIWRDLWSGTGRRFTPVMKERYLSMTRRQDVLERLAQDGPIGDAIRHLSFPKGRCNPGETMRSAALREFQEETKIPHTQLINVAPEPLLHAYVGTDGMPYCSVLYVAELKAHRLSGSSGPSGGAVKGAPRSDDGFPRVSLSNESSELVWLTAAETRGSPHYNILSTIDRAPTRAA